MSNAQGHNIMYDLQVFTVDDRIEKTLILGTPGKPAYATGTFLEKTPEKIFLAYFLNILKQ